MKMKRFLLVVLSLLLLLAFGCSKDTNNSSVTNPNNPDKHPVGYIQGKVVDSCTGDPIVGAVVDIGLAKATTNINGQYTMKNVPATTYLGENYGCEDCSGWYGDYSATINMTNAYANHNGTQVPNTKYANIYYNEVEVAFSSFNESEGNVETSSNHDTLIDHLGNGDFDFYLGQLTAGINQTVLMASDHTPAANYVVYIFSNDDGRDGNNASGFSGHKVWQGTTGADGSFTATGLEAGKSFGIMAIDTASSGGPKFEGFSSFMSGCDGSIWYASQYDYMYVRSTDDICPFLLSVTPTKYSDVDGRLGAIDVVFTFSEPILATPSNTGQGLTPSPYWGSLYNDVWVLYLGNKTKVGNIDHTLSWNAAMTQLTITIPSAAVAPGAVYSVAIMNNEFLYDASGNYLSTPPNSEGDVPCEFNPFQYLFGTIFSTFGTTAAGAITDLRIVNPTLPDLVDYDTAFGLDWTPVVGAKSYHVYCQLIQWPGLTTFPCDQPISSGQAHPYALVAVTDGTGVQFSHGPFGPLSLMPNINWILLSGLTNLFDPDGFNDWYFVEDYGIKLAYQCYVRGVDLDGIEGPIPTTPLYIEDKVQPQIDSHSCVSGGSISAIYVCFNEPMNEKTVETIANWTLNAAAFSGTAPTITSIDLATYMGSNPCATIYLSGSGTLVGTPGTALLTAGGTIQDVSGNALNCSTTLVGPTACVFNTCGN